MKCCGAGRQGQHAQAGVEPGLHRRRWRNDARAWARARFPSRCTAAGDDGFERWCADHPDYIPWEDEFSDIGKSAFKDYKRRGALTAIIELAEKGKVGDNPCLVIDSVSRLCREPQKEANKLLNRIFDAGLSISVCELGNQIWTEKDQIVYIIFQVMFLVAHGESREKSHRIKGMHDNHIERLKEGDLSMMFTERSPSIKKYFYPFWLDFHKATRTKDAHFTKNEKSEWAAKMFEWATEVGSPEISKRLADMDVYAPNKKVNGLLVEIPLVIG